MRLGIRRKLIGTLILVGLFPLVISLVVILGGGAAIQLREIRARYEDTAAMCSDHISDTLLHEEIEKLLMVSRLPRVDAYVRSQNNGTLGPGPVPARSAQDDEMDQRWAALKETDSEIKNILHNELSERLKLLSNVDGHPRHTMVTNAAGQLIASDTKTDDFFQADEDWWQAAWNGGKGKLFISSIRTSTGQLGDLPAGDQDVEIALPIYDDVNGKTVITGILKDELSVTWLLRTLRDLPASKHLEALTQLVDLKSRAAVYSFRGDATVSPSDPQAASSLQFYLDHQSEAQIHAMTLLSNHIIIGSSKITLPEDLKNSPSISQFDAELPQWAVVVSNPSDAAMNPVYHLATIVAVVGIALILILFIMGVAISNREIIMPIIRLREATAAVGRGELNVRVLPSDAPDKTFRRDELGELAHDFDEMTRQLQKNVNQLARSNEAKRRFMELASHELRTPVTYLLGVCQLAQKQLQSLTAAATDGAPETPETAEAAARSAAAVANALSKISIRTQRLNRIIENLLKLVNNDQFTTRLVKEPVNVGDLIQQVASDHRPFIVERKQTLTVDIAPGLPAIDADRDKLEDALTNLLSNAIRFSPDAGTVRLAAHEVAGDMLEVLVEDSGPGIPPEDLANLFEPFYTGSDILHHHSGALEYGARGLGLGLAIVRRFIELHGGIVRATPIPGDGKVAGMRFQILLPITRPAAAE
ncbi:MAG TPA: HAMP domain-containing sensor histidine kinase [Phycisphaerae bacterium]|nr:HAMP domain-containing sensor histidine kinase [Phycisphaerae bacterium]